MFTCSYVFPVLIWDDSQRDINKKLVLEFTFSQPVVGVRMRKDRLSKVILVDWKPNFQHSEVVQRNIKLKVVF